MLKEQKIYLTLFNRTKRAISKAHQHPVEYRLWPSSIIWQLSAINLNSVGLSKLLGEMSDSK